MQEKIEIIIYSLVSLIILIVSLIFDSGLLNIIISLTGVFYVYLIGKKKLSAYFFGIINVTLLGIVLLSNKIYFNGLYNLLYGLPILIYGFYYWKYKIEENKNNVMSKKMRIILFLSLTIFLFSLGIIGILNNDLLLNNLDIMTAVMGFLGLFLLTNKYIEQWPIWIVSNTINFILWTVLSISNITNISVALMWFIYLANSIYGLILWNKKIVYNITRR